MLLPNHSFAVVDSAKVRDYLLSQEHPDGASKAVVFESVGAALIASSPFGHKFRVSATLRGPNGSLFITTIWIVRRGEDFPRFVTAYPGARP